MTWQWVTIICTIVICATAWIAMLLWVSTYRTEPYGNNGS